MRRLRLLRWILNRTETGQRLLWEEWKRGSQAGIKMGAVAHDIANAVCDEADPWPGAPEARCHLPKYHRTPHVYVRV